MDKEKKEDEILNKPHLRLILKRIKELALKKGWNLNQLAIQADLTSGAIYLWYKREKYPNLESICKICKACEISVYEFFASTHEEVIEAKASELNEIVRNFEADDLDAVLTVAKAIAKKSEQ